MIKVFFFARIRELIGVKSINILEKHENISSLILALSQKGVFWKIALNSNTLLVAVNHTLVSLNHPLNSGDEVAFFPPVTGG
ncbi:molybdopterin synthase sulfur carrier subunit [Candidatus Pantoea edessiphila]|uniref:Molybdopterin synthase sulfur carrier subunit n=1 Tax=Candidatus Pantoea edessiphila TaxID=2044610 RepID=A0A2P5SZ27_9GAMM|nr:molybdopterin synthase sulfur carrier subunit [Candidatus Pantoea edessiphila]MBK4775311.1 molybdopterin synthase sulfur carrier subunit [Pantoea sp. Edef]PPI87552.1 molybdopterin synthase sulfur carrier subunit [Candidatus Pantoea edessiphila]